MKACRPLGHLSIFVGIAAPLGYLLAEFGASPIPPGGFQPGQLVGLALCLGIAVICCAVGARLAVDDGPSAVRVVEEVARWARGEPR